VTDWLVEEKIRVLKAGESIQHDEDIILERKGERDRLRGIEEVRQQGLKDEGSKKRKEWLEFRLEMSKIQEKLTKSGGQ